MNGPLQSFQSKRHAGLFLALLKMVRMYAAILVFLRPEFSKVQLQRCLTNAATRIYEI